MYRILYAHGFFSLSRAFIGAVLVLYLLGKGIDISVIATAKSAQLVASVIFNYPAGKISDKYGNKVTILLACIAELFYFYLMLDPSNEKVIVGEIFNGLGIALYVGSYEAWIFTHKSKKEDSFSLISRSSEVLFIATIISGIIGATFAPHSLLLSLTFMFFALLMYSLTPEKRERNKRENLSGIINGIKKILKTSNYNVINYIIFAGMMQLIYQFWPVFFSTEFMSLSQKEIGYVFAGSMVAQWVVISIARKKGFNSFKKAPEFCYIAILLSSIITIFLPYFNIGTNNRILIVLIYCIFLSLCTLTSNYYFSKSCNLYSDSADESSMISLLDTSARCMGAIILTIISSLHMKNVYFIWSLFPAFTFILMLIFFYKKIRGVYGNK